MRGRELLKSTASVLVGAAIAVACVSRGLGGVRGCRKGTLAARGIGEMKSEYNILDIKRLHLWVAHGLFKIIESVRLPAGLPALLPTCLSVCPSVCLPAYLSVCLAAC